MQFASSRADELSNRGRKTIDLKQQLTEVGANAFLKLAEAPIWVQAREVCENWKSKRERERGMAGEGEFFSATLRVGGRIKREEEAAERIHSLLFWRSHSPKCNENHQKKTRLIFNQFFFHIRQTVENNGTRKPSCEKYNTKSQKRLKILKMASSSALTKCQNKKTNSWEPTTLFAKILISTGCPNKF